MFLHAKRPQRRRARRNRCFHRLCLDQGGLFFNINMKGLKHAFRMLCRRPVAMKGQNHRGWHFVEILVICSPVAFQG